MFTFLFDNLKTNITIKSLITTKYKKNEYVNFVDNTKKRNKYLK